MDNETKFPLDDAICAYVTYSYVDMPSVVLEGIISFGTFDTEQTDDEYDTNGILDSDVFYHAEKDMFFDLYKHNIGGDFYITSHQFCYNINEM